MHHVVVGGKGLDHLLIEVGDGEAVPLEDLAAVVLEEAQDAQEEDDAEDGGGRRHTSQDTQVVAWVHGFILVLQFVDRVSKDLLVGEHPERVDQEEHWSEAEDSHRILH